MIIINLRACLYSGSLPMFAGVDHIRVLVPIVLVFYSLGVNILDLQKQSVPISNMWHSQKRWKNGLIILINYHLLTYMNKLFNILVEFVFKLLFLTFSTIGVWSHWCAHCELIKTLTFCSTGVYSILLYTINTINSLFCLACYVMLVYYCNVSMFNSTLRIGPLKQRELGENRLNTSKKRKHE